MHPALWSSKSGLDGQSRSLEVISHNLANVNTTSFKKSVAIFKDTMYRKLKQPGAESAAGNEIPSGLLIGTGVQMSGTEKDFKPGTPIQTDNSLDMYINGRGFFQVQRPDGTTAYTRDGKFQMNSSGTIVNSDGLELQPSITIPSDALSITITDDGTVTVLSPGNTTPAPVGTIQIADFANISGLEAIGDNLFLETNSSGTATVGTAGTNGIGGIEQGALEASNVNVVEELVKMIQTQRGYEMNAKSVETVDKMLQFITQVL